MGMMMIQPGAAQPHTKSVACEWMGCKPVADEKPKVPEFTIVTRYVAKGILAAMGGWSYLITWEVPGREGDPPRTGTRSGYAFTTEDAAHKAAEERATEIARSLLPTNTYKFTPEV